MKAGDKVLCINDNNLYHIPVRCICEGLIYTLAEVFTCKCGNVYVRLEEVYKDFNMWCPKCNTFQYTKMFFHIERFRLLDQGENTEKEYGSIKAPVHNRIIADQ
jgi:hypothetical protein